MSKAEVESRDRQIAEMQAQLTSLKQGATYWQQFTAIFEPVQLRSMRAHHAFMLPSGAVLALHFDKLPASEAQNLNWVALGIPGKNCKQDQERIEAQFGKGFTHFHDMERDTHGGAVGANGVWFMHVAVREFDSPMSGGPVKPGVDQNFMPTPPQAC